MVNFSNDFMITLLLNMYLKSKFIESKWISLILSPMFEIMKMFVFRLKNFDKKITLRLFYDNNKSLLISLISFLKSLKFKI